MLFPAHFDIRGDVLLVPDLHARVSLFDKDNKPIVHLGDDAAWRKKVLDGFKVREQAGGMAAGQVRASARRLLRPRWEYLRGRMGANRPRDPAAAVV